MPFGPYGYRNYIIQGHLLNGSSNLASRFAYLPAATSPPVSPSYNSHWDDTSFAGRSLGRWDTPSGSSDEIVSSPTLDLSTISVTTRAYLFRQYLFPLTNMALAPEPAFFLTIGKVSGSTNAYNSRPVWGGKVVLAGTFNAFHTAPQVFPVLASKICKLDGTLRYDLQSALTSIDVAVYYAALHAAVSRDMGGSTADTVKEGDWLVIDIGFKVFFDQVNGPPSPALGQMATLYSQFGDGYSHYMEYGYTGVPEVYPGNAGFKLQYIKGSASIIV